MSGEKSSIGYFVVKSIFNDMDASLYLVDDRTTNNNLNHETIVSRFQK
jgi:hypothetical protein